MAEVYVMPEHAPRIVANHVVKEGYDRRLSNHTFMSPVDIVFQICANSQMKLGCRATFTFIVCHILGLSPDPFDGMIRGGKDISIR